MLLPIRLLSQAIATAPHTLDWFPLCQQYSVIFQYSNTVFKGLLVLKEGFRIIANLVSWFCIRYCQFICHIACFSGLEGQDDVSSVPAACRAAVTTQEVLYVCWANNKNRRKLFALMESISGKCMSSHVHQRDTKGFPLENWIRTIGSCCCNRAHWQASAIATITGKRYPSGNHKNR